MVISKLEFLKEKVKLMQMTDCVITTVNRKRGNLKAQITKTLKSVSEKMLDISELKTLLEHILKYRKNWT